MFHATFSFRAEKVKLSKEETGVGISRLSCTAASVATGLFFCLQPKKLNGEKAKELTLEQKVENQQDVRARVYVEHGVRWVKARRIMRDEFRLGIGLFSLVASATVGMAHLGRIAPG